MTEQPNPPQPVNPFKGIPARDVWRDVVALGLLVAALFYDWSQGDSGAELWYVDIATVVAITGLSLTYLAKLGVLGPSWTSGASQLYRLASALPYALAVLAVVILDIADDRAVGVGVAVGLAGAVLVAQPRTHELPATVLAPSDGLWLRITAVLTAAAALMIVLSTLLFIDDLDDRGTNVAGIIIFVLAGVIVAAALLLPALGVLRGRPQSVALVAGIGLAVLVLGMLHIDEHNLTQFFGWPVLIGGWEGIDLPGFGAFLLAAAGAAALSPGASRSTGGTTHPVSLVGAAKGAFLLVAATALVHLLAPIFALAGYDGAELGSSGIATLICYAIVLALALLGFVSTTPGASVRVPVTAAAGAAFVVVALVIAIAIIDEGYFGFVSLIVGNASYATDSWLVAILVAAAIGIALVGPATVGSALRRALQNAQTANDPATAAGAPLPTAPAAPTPAAPAPAPAPTPQPAPPVVEQPAVEEPVAEPTLVGDPVDAALQEASDPATEPARLADLAHHHPHTRPAIARHPQAYPGLLEWLGSLGDPEVDAALQERRP
ncbi:MAG TPA: hypothetical protein VNZ66_08910 [Aeromicrobium sp.]|nr:hypothetical protein [Aeromicrobium sp.]